MEIEAFAKLNLTLDVLGRRPDGYHDLRMVMQTVDLADALTLEEAPDGTLSVRSGLPFLPTGEKNLAAAAALRFWEALGAERRGLAITIRKRIPVCAGMGGGSSDAAAVLRALNREAGEPFSPAELARIGERVGSDVPYCVLGGTALAEGRGERLTPLPALPACWVVVCKPEFSVSTPELFAKIDSVRPRCRPDTEGAVAALAAGDLGGVARRMYNVFEDVLPERHRARVAAIKHELIQCGALGANMTGTGSAVFGLFSDRTTAEAACERLREFGREIFLARTL